MFAEANIYYVFFYGLAKSTKHCRVMLSSKLEHSELSELQVENTSTVCDFLGPKFFVVMETSKGAESFSWQGGKSRESGIQGGGGESGDRDISLGSVNILC